MCMMTLLGFLRAGHNRFAAVPAARLLLAEPVLGATVLGGPAGHHTRGPTRWPHDGPHNRRLAWVAQMVQAAGPGRAGAPLIICCPLLPCASDALRSEALSGRLVL
jgi:hypothetical protein